ncbi:cytochrome P450 [Mycena rosella]|uniref:Cytochrome P450 n=1 Tax=Mycena rosella TaxID=1033263 RepID=A0AAD7FLC8_MYCRO|nr:cytochrome P450 [Mycena rosella]
MLFDPYSLILFATAIVALYCLQLRRSRVKLPFPPGPRKLPLVGNLFDVPATFAWEKYMEWSRTYSSDILHLNAAGTSLIILSSTKAATDLLDKKSAIYSNRPRMPMVTELMGWDFNFDIHCSAFSSHLHRRMHRRLFHSVFHNEAAQLFRPTELTATHELLRRILHDPDAVMDHLRHMAGEIIMSVTYGIDVLPKNDPYVALAEHAVQSLADASIPGRFLVDSIPILKHVPEWIPGAGFQRQAKAWKGLARRMTTGNAPYSFTASALRTLDDAENKEHQETAVKSIAAAIYTGGTDTTVSALSSFILAMLCFPDVQKKAQAEIDSVVREGHLPDFDDEPSLPYVSAVVKEVLRWRPVAPMGIPHFLSVEDEYQGYRIPAGSIVIANACSHMPFPIIFSQVMYPDPYTFKPERFLLDGKPNPAIGYPDAAFGYGRRICPGRHMATSSVFITVASILAAFNITKTVGDDGKLIEPSQEYTSSLITSPLPFKCSIKPRSRAALELIRATEKI